MKTNCVVKNKNILMLTPVGDFRGGAERSVLPSVEAITNTGYRLVVCTSNRGAFANELQELGAQLHFTGVPDKYLCIGKRNFFGALINTLKVNFIIWKMINRQEVDLLYCNDVLTLEWCILALLCSDEKQPKIIVHGRLVHVGPLHKLNFHLLKKHFSVIFTSQFMAATIAEHFANKPWSSEYILHNSIGTPGDKGIYGGFSAVSLRKKYGIDPSKKLFCYIGRFASWKNIHHIIEAFSLLPKTVRPHLLIVGKPTGATENNYNNFLKELIAGKKLEKHIHFAGYHYNIKPFLEACNALVIPSENEPFGRVVVEAQILGVPVIGARSGGIPEILDERLGILFDLGNIEQLASAIRTVIHSDYDEETGKIVASATQARFNSKTYKTKFLKIITSYMENK